MKPYKRCFVSHWQRWNCLCQNSELERTAAQRVSLSWTVVQGERNMQSWCTKYWGIGKVQFRSTTFEQGQAIKDFRPSVYRKISWYCSKNVSRETFFCTCIIWNYMVYYLHNSSENTARAVVWEGLTNSGVDDTEQCSVLLSTNTVRRQSIWIKKWNQNKTVFFSGAM